MKKALFLLMVCLNAFTLFSQDLKSVVAIVKPEVSESQKNFSTNLGNALAGKGYFAAAKEIRSYESGWFGSGFLTKNSKDQFVIVTNKHVVKSLKYMNVEFSVNGASVTYSKCKVIYSSKHDDLAVLALPADAKFKEFLSISSTPVKDGDDVWSAGFPGLGDKPTWQLGKGIVSNSAVKDEDFGENVTVIQHTAQVDQGNSGGPLMVSSVDANGEKHYSVVGVNTWKANGRENTNFAIPSKSILACIESLDGTAEPASVKDFNTAVSGFASSVKSGFESVAPLIDDEYLYTIDKSSFIMLLSNASEDAKSKADKLFVDAKPMDGLRVLVADCICRNLSKKAETFSLEKADTPSSGDNVAYANFSYKGKSNATTWRKDGSEWKLASFDLVDFSSQEEGESSSNNSSFSSKKNKPVHVITPDWNEFFINTRIGTDYSTKMLIEFGFSNSFADYGISRYCLYGGKVARREMFDVLIPDDGWNSDYEEVELEYEGKAFGAMYNIGVMVPISFQNRFCLAPYFTPGIGNAIEFYDDPYDDYDSYYYSSSFSDVNIRFIAELRGGARLGWLMNHSSASDMLYINVEFARQWMPSFDDGSFSRNLIGLGVGFCF